jgi:hypothetical protein
MKIVKLSTPFGHTFLPSQIDPSISDYKFEIDNDCTTCDFWIIWGDLPSKIEKMTVVCPWRNIIFMTDEVFPEKKFNSHFLNQFKTIISCRDDLIHNNIIRTHEINNWTVRKAYPDVYNTTHIEKKKVISVVCSDLTWLPGHKKRYAFVNKLIGHFKDRLDVYGRGFNPIEDKWMALAPYKYSIAIENSSFPGYFTEKITDCFLSHTYPIYFGAPDIGNYFDLSALLNIDINDYKTAISLIEHLLEDNQYEKREALLIKQKMTYLKRYHLFPALCNILSELQNPESDKKKNSIRAHRTFSDHYQLHKLFHYVKTDLLSLSKKS